MDDVRIDSVTSELLAVPLPPVMRAYGYEALNVVLVTITDADGRQARGFTYTLDAGAVLVCRMVDDLIAPMLAGSAPAEWGGLTRRLQKTTRRLGATLLTPALSAVDIAIWDLRGLQASLPLYALLGGEPAGIPFYGSGRSGHRLTTEELVRNSLDYLDEGFDGVKIAIGAKRPEEDLTRIRAVRDAIGESARLMVDGGERMTLIDALWMAPRLAELGVYWFEEPLVAEDVAGYGVLSRQSPVPIATGEHLQGRAAFERYLGTTAVSMYQPDAALGGGITEMMAVAAIAGAHGRPLSWHAFADLHIHLGVSAPMTRYMEDFPMMSGIIDEPLRPHQGKATPSARAGHGIRWDLDAIAAARIPV